jgi:hypothetical protein
MAHRLRLVRILHHRNHHRGHAIEITIRRACYPQLSRHTDATARRAALRTACVCLDATGARMERERSVGPRRGRGAIREEAPRQRYSTSESLTLPRPTGRTPRHGRGSGIGSDPPPLEPRVCDTCLLNAVLDLRFLSVTLRRLAYLFLTFMPTVKAVGRPRLSRPAPQGPPGPYSLRNARHHKQRLHQDRRPKTACGELTGRGGSGRVQCVSWACEQRRKGGTGRGIRHFGHGHREPPQQPSCLHLLVTPAHRENRPSQSTPSNAPD